LSSTVMRNKYKRGATLLELLVGLAISGILIAVVWSVTSNSIRSVEVIGGAQNTDFTAKFFIDSFVSDVESASNTGNLPAIWVNGIPLPANGVPINSNGWTISILSVVPATKTGPMAAIDPTYSQLVTYRLSPYVYDQSNTAAMARRQLSFPNELKIEKSKLIWAGTIPNMTANMGPPASQGSERIAGGEVILVKVRSFACTPNVSTYIGGLDCTLEMFGNSAQDPQAGQSQIRTFRFYADAKNQP
jgi:prepilin-type N-terminal cleavage/methylation domain-containing protein